MSERKQQFKEVYLNIAKEVGTLSRCIRAKVGAVIVKDGNIVAYGYNGTPSGFSNVCEEDNVTLPEVIHAECNAILKAGRDAKGADLYLTLSPCVECCKLIKQAGIKTVYFRELYRNTEGLDKLKINYVHIPSISES
jgi:dCMP deaminase